MAYPHHGGQLQDRDAAATHRAEPCIAVPAGAATAKPCTRRVNAARRAISCFMAAMLVVTMNPVANHLSAFAAPSDAFGGGALNDVPAPQVGETDGSGQGQDAAAEAKEPGGEPDAGPADPAAESNEELAATETPNAAGNGASTAGGAAASEATQEDPAEDAAPSYTTWADVAEAVESGELSGEGFKPVGSGTAEDPYAVATPEAFAWWALLHADADARLDADLDLTERGGEPLPWPGDATLSGELDGASHAVAFATEGAGLFAEVAAGGAVRWLKLGRTDAEARSAADAGDPVAEVASAAALAGSVAGVNKGEIEGVVNRMPVGFSAGAPADAERSAGGIVARNDGAIADCANLGAVSNDAAAGDSAAAGIAARGNGTVATSYNAGGVKAAQNAAYIMTLLDAEGDYASVVDEATCYLAPGEGAAYEGVSEAGQDRPGALTAPELADAAARLNAGREGDAAAWSTGSDATNGFPAPAKPKNPDAQASPAPFAAAPRATTYASWLEVGKAVYDGTLTGTNFLPTGKGTQASHYIVKTPEALAAFSYAAAMEVSPLKNDATSTPALESYVDIDPSVTKLDLFGSAYSGIAKQTDASGLVTNVDDALLWWPIGLPENTTDSSAIWFTGTFNGNGCTLSAMRCGFSDLTSWSIGFIASAKDGALVENVHIGADSKVASGGSAGAVVGSLVGDSTATQGSTVRNCANAGIVQGMGSKAVGGIVGTATGKNGTISHAIEGCSNSGLVSTTSTGATGGIVGQMTFSSVSDCSNSGTIEGKNLAGGIGANVGKTQFSRCFNEGPVTAATHAGGIAGVGALGFESCGNAGAVTVKGGTTDGAAAGGIGGAATATSSSKLAIENCYNTGTVSNEEAGARAAGLVGTPVMSGTPVDEVVCTVSSSYNAGIVRAPNGGEAYALVGTQKGSTDLAQGITRTTCFYADDVDGADPSTYLDKSITGLAAKHTADMKTIAFVKELNGGKYIGDAAGTLSTAWTTDAQKNGAASLKNSGFPVSGDFEIYGDWASVGAAVEAGTVAGKPIDGDGSASSPFLISTPAQLAWFAYKVNSDPSGFAGKSAKLTADIDLAGFSYTGKEADGVGENLVNCLPWVSIGNVASTGFTGQFDGNGHTVSNMYLPLAADATSHDAQGFVGTLRGAGTVSNVKVGGYISTEYAPATEQRYEAFGGVAGALRNTAAVKNCASSVVIFAEQGSFMKGAGGVVGAAYDGGTVVSSCSYARGATITLKGVFDVEGLIKAGAGGILGYSEGVSIEDCYSSGLVQNGGFQVRFCCVGGILGYAASGTTNIAASYCAAYGLVPSGSDVKTGAIVGFSESGSGGVVVKRCVYSIDMNYPAYGDTAEPIPSAWDVYGLPQGQMPNPNYPFPLENPVYYGMVSLLNGSRTGADAVWTQAGYAINDGLPILAASENVYNSWEAVGKAVAENTKGMGKFKPAEQSVTWADGSTGQAYVIDSPEQLAWFSYMVRTDGPNYSSKNVQLASDIDLSGFTYNGALEVGDNYANCMEWLSIGVASYKSEISQVTYSGRFDGAGHVVKNLRLKFDGDICGGFIGYADAETTVVERLGLATGCMEGAETDGSATLVGGWGFKGVVRNCFSRVDVRFTGGNYFNDVAGMVSWISSGASVTNCYYAGQTASFVQPFTVANSGGTVANVFYDSSKTAEVDTVATPKTTSELKSTDMVALLNGSADAWDIDSKNRNGGYPVILRPGEAPTPTSWEVVGKQMEAGVTGMPAKPSVQSVQLSGETSAKDAYVINNAEQLAWFSYMVRTKAANLATQNVQLADNIDLAGLNYKGEDAVADDYSNCLEWLPIGGGNSGTSYSGIFDGAGKVIRNLYVNQSSTMNLGLIGSANGATVQCVGLESGRLVGQGNLGGLVGFTDGVVKVSDCWNAASIVRTGTARYENTGGLVGGNEHAGGPSIHVEINRCYNKGSVYSADTVGDSAIGGIAGYAPGSSKISDCYNAGSVSGAHQAGGIVGAGGTGTSGGTNYTYVKNCYNTGIVERGGQANSAVAAWRSNFSNCYTLPGSTENRFTTSGTPTEITEAQLKSWGAAYQLNEGNGIKTFADVSGTWRTDTANVNSGYPVLCSSGESLASASTWSDVGQWVDVFAPGSKPTNAGTLVDPYQIGNEQQLAWWVYKMSAENATFTGSHVKLTADINLIGTPFNGQTEVGGSYNNCLRWPVVSTLSGVFDGDGHAISNARVRDGDGTAFFSTVTGTIKRLNLASGCVYGRTIAGLARTVTGASAAIEDCTVGITVLCNTSIYQNRMSYSAGIVYTLSNGARIERCASMGSITTNNNSNYMNEPYCTGRVGGIAAESLSGSIVRNCYRQGYIQANSIKPGNGGYGACIVGYNNGQVENCFADNSVGGQAVASTSYIMAGGSGTVKNCYSIAADRTEGGSTVKHLSTTQMQTRGFAVNLNGNTSGAGTAWTWTSGYPTFGELPEVDWLDVGGFVANDEGAFGSFKPTTGDGTSAATALEIATPEALAWYGYQARQGAAPVFAKLTADIDLGGYATDGSASWAPITGKDGAAHAGTFDGGGYTVKNMTVDNKRGETSVGLFGTVSGPVSGITVTDSTVDGGAACSSVGAIAGSASGTLARCGVTDTVEVTNTKEPTDAMDNVGGLAGVVLESGSVKDCFSRAAVSSQASGNVGGLVGFFGSGATVFSSYAAAKSISGGYNVGMIAGQGSVATFTTCFWLEGSAFYPSGDGSPITGTGNEAKTAVQMRSALLAFELNTGRTDADAPWTWNLLKNGGYPTFGEPPADVDASTWAGIGRLQVEDVLRRTQVVFNDKNSGTMGDVHDEQPTGGSYIPALEGSGVEGDPYIVRTPEALAWWGYQVNHNINGFTHDATGVDTATEFGSSHVRVGAALDLAGLAYTGASEVGTDHVNCLEWSPLCYTDAFAFSVVFDGGGFPITNVRLVGEGNYPVGFFGAFEAGSPSIRRVLLASGTLDVAASFAGTWTGTLSAYGAVGSITDCASLVDVMGSPDNVNGFGGFIGEAYGMAVSNCYYGGSIDPASSAKPFVDSTSTTYAPVNCYHAGDDEADPYAAGVPADQLASWGAAYALNGGDGSKALSTMTSWREAADGENGGYPVPCADGETMGAASDWSDVGAWVDAYATDKKPSGSGTASGSGTTGPFQISSPEAFAWFAYKVDANALATANQNAVLVGGVDLAGNQYTGKRGTGSNFDACLTWDPIGAFDNSDGKTKSVFQGRFDGQGHEVSNLLLSASGRLTGGLFGYASTSSSIVRTGIASGAMVEVQQADTWGSLVGLSMGEVSDCYSRVDLYNSSTIYNPNAFGGLLGSDEGGSVTRCYYAGANSANKRCIGKVDGGTVGSNVYFVGEAADDSNATALTQAQLASWGAAYALGGGDGVKMPTDLKTWRMPTTDSDNGGYPVLVPNDATGDAAHLQNAADWSDVGGWVALTGTFKPSVGTGATASPFELASREALAWFAYMVNEHGSETTPSGGVKWGAASAKLTVDIDMSAAYGGADTKWMPIGNGGLENGTLTNAYSGTFDGNSHTVTNLITGTGVNAAGLVGTLEGTVKGVGMAASSLTGGGAAGGIVGMAGQGAVIERCTVAKDVTVTSTGYTGGLAGLMYKTASAKDCWTRATVAAGTTSGGFVGSLEGDAVLSSCYAAAGVVDGSGKKGSFVAHEGTKGSVERCCFQKASGLGAVETGNAGKFSEKTAFQMKSPMTVMLLNDGRMGANNVWTQSAEANDGYPVLGSTVVTVTTWGHVGSGQSEDELRRTQVVYDAKGFGTMDAVHDEQPSDGSYVPALEGSGVEGDPYVVRTPEALAWWTYMVNYNSFGLTHDSSGAETSIDFVNSYVLVDAPIDLAGFAYTGASEVGTNHKNCLEWSSISHEASGSYAFFTGNFDGGGLPIANVRLEGGKGYEIGFFGHVEGALNVKRVLLASGTLDVSGTTQSNVEAGTMIAGALGGTVEDCASLVNIVGTSANVTTFGGFAGLRDIDLVIRNCYYGGTIDPASGAKSFLGENNFGQAPVNCYYAGDDAADPYAKGVTSDQLASWGAAYALNGGDGSKALSTMTSWRAAADGENGGFPVPCKDGESLAAASDWSDVGAWVDAFATDKKPKSESVTWRDGGTGAAYKINNAEQLAWLAYKVNQDVGDALPAAEQNAVLMADLDLSGYAYTGKSEGTPGANFENCLEWSPIGSGKDHADPDGSNWRVEAYFGRFDGRGCTVDNLRYKGETDIGHAGLFGWTEEASVVERVGITSGFADAGEYVGSLVGMMCGTVRDCYSLAEVGSGYFHGGLIGSPEDPAVIWNCYYAGPSDVPTYGMEDNAGYRGNNYYLSATPDDSRGEYDQQYGRTADQLKSWGAAYQLNEPLNTDGTQKAFGDLKTWRAAKDTDGNGVLDENNGFPVLIKEGDSSTSMQSASNWGEVGEWIDAFGTDDATDKTHPLRPQENASHAWRDGTTSAAFELSSPEQLAWFAYKTNSDDAYLTKSVHLTRSMDLAGFAYTGQKVPGDKYANCLAWTTIGGMSWSSPDPWKYYQGRFDGAGHPITNMRIPYNPDYFMGMFGFVGTGGLIERVGIASGSLDVSPELHPQGVFAALIEEAWIVDCYSRVDLFSSSTIERAEVGGIVGSLTSNGIKNCYFAGTVAPELQGDDAYGSKLSGPLVGIYEGGSLINSFNNASSGVEDTYVTAIPDEALKAWGGAYQLNAPLYKDADGTQKQTGLANLVTWRMDEEGLNGGYPVLIEEGAEAGKDRMQAASSWADVGMWVDVFTNTNTTVPEWGEGMHPKLPTEVNAPASWGSAADTKAYSIDSAEDIAWLAYKVNTDNAEFGSKNVMLADNVDLFGETYTGKTFDASGSLNDQLNTNGLPWVPIGKTDSLGDASRRFLGVLDGQNRVVRHLVTDPSAFSSGLFGRLDGQVSNIAIAASNVRAHYDDGYAAPIAARMEGSSSVRQCSVGQDVTVSGLAPGGVAGRIGNEDEATVTIVDCFSRADVQGKMLSGGIVSFAGKGVSIDSCYFAGTAKFAIADNTNSATKGANNYYQEGKPTQYSSSISATKLSAAEMTADKGSSLASKLNAGRKGKDAPWRGDSKGVNDAYPVILLPADIMADWGEVGARQSEDELRRTEVLDVDGFGTMGAVHDARPSGGSYVPALEGSGTEADPYIFRTPEAFAWWGYMVNEHGFDLTHNEDGTETTMTFGTSHAKQGANFDLSGLMYAGTDTVGSNHENCLMWDPISYYDSISGSEIMYWGSFDGAGYRIANLRLVAVPDGVTGLFGDPNDGTIKRVTLSSGTLDVANMESYDDAGSIVGLSASITLRDCVSLVDVVGVPSAFRTIGGVIGYPYDSTVENCYYGGTIASGVPANPVVDEPESATSLANLFYLDGGVDDPSATGLTANQLASWGAAYQLNAPLSADGTQKAFGDLKTWRMAADGENNGFPVPCKDGESLGAASDWGDVGAWVDAFGTDDAADKAHPLRPQEKADHTWQDTTMGAAFELSSPEQLAWFSYKANSDNAFMSKNVAITADIDLAGFEYTGKSDVEANNKYAGCLTWVPIGATAAYDKGFSAHFDGGGFLVRNIRIVDDSDTMNLGLFGYTTGAHIERVGLASGAMVLNACLAGTLAAGVEGANIGSAEYGLVEDCFSKVDVYDAPAAVDHMEQGGLIGNQCGAHVRNCYYAGTIEADLVLRYTVAMNEDGDFTNVLFAGRSDADDLAGDPIPADQLAGWGGAYQLNAPLYKDADGVQRQKPFADLGTWREDTENVNGGYPVLVRDADSDSLAHLRAATDWGEVGAWVDTFSNTKNPDYFPDYDGGMEPEKPAEIDAPASWGAPAGTKAYAIETPEDLAWFAYKVNTDNANFGTKSAVLSANVNLFGETYTGTAFNETADLNGQLMSALPWTPIGVASAGGDKKSFAGTFDGQGMAVEHLATAADTYYGGLFGDVQGAVRGTTVKSSDIQGQVYAGAIAAHLSGTSDKRASVETSSSAKDVTVRSSDSSSAAGGVVGHAGWSSAEAEVLNCFSRATVSGGAGKTAGVVGSAGYAEIKNSYFAGTAPRAVVGGSVGPVTSERTYYLEGSATDTAKPDGFGAQKLTDAELKSWRTAYKLNGDSFVGQEQTDGSTLAHTAWTVDDVATPVNDGYPVFGDLTVVEQDITLDAAKAIDSNDGTVSATLPTALVGKVELLEAPDVSGLGDPAAGGAELVDPADVKAGFASWGTDSANGKLGLSVGATAVTSASTAGDVLSTSGAADVSLNAAAAYNSAVERSVSFIAVNGAKAYRIAATLPAVTSKTLDVTVPVEAAGGSFDVSPDGKAHTLGGGTGKEAAKAAAPSVLKNNGKVPLAGALSSAAPLPVSEASGISEALSPGTAPLTDSNDPVTDAGRTRLGVTTASGATGKNTVSPTITDPLFLQPSADGTPGSIPLYFAVQGSLEASDPNALAWSYFLEYSGTYLKDGTKFGFSTGYELYLPKGDVDEKALVSSSKLESGGPASVSSTSASTESGVE